MNSAKKLWVVLIFMFPILGCSATSKFSSSDEYLHLYDDKVKEGYKLIKTWRDYSVEERNGMLIYKQYTLESRQLYHMVLLRKSDVQKHGNETEWYGNGNLRLEGSYFEGKKNGTWKYYSHRNGKLEEYGQYIDNERTGTWTHVDSLGETTALFNYAKDKLHGRFYLYNKNGDLYKEGEYIKGKLNSISKYNEVDFHPQEITEKNFKLISCENANKDARQLCRGNNFDLAARSIADYPSIEETRKVTGTALVYIEIDETGKISEFEILRSMSQNFTHEINKLKDIDFVFEPAYSEGKPYKTSHIIALGYFPPEGTYYYDPFLFNDFMMPPPPSFKPPSF